MTRTFEMKFKTVVFPVRNNEQVANSCGDTYYEFRVVVDIYDKGSASFSVRIFGSMQD